MRIGGWESAIRGALAEKSAYVIEAITSILASVMTGYHTQHTFDDQHSTITATGSIAERKRTIPLGEWYDVPFVPGNFTGFTTMTWTVTAAGQKTCAYTLIGMTMIFAFDLRSTTIGGVTTAAVQILIPGGWFAKNTLRNPCYLIDNGVISTGYALVTANSNLVQVFRTDNVPFTAAAATTTVQGEITFPVRTA